MPCHVVNLFALLFNLQAEHKSLAFEAPMIGGLLRGMWRESFFQAIIWKYRLIYLLIFISLNLAM